MVFYLHSNTDIALQYGVDKQKMRFNVQLTILHHLDFFMILSVATLS